VEIKPTPHVIEGAFIRLVKNSSNTTLEGVIGSDRDYPWARRLDSKDKRITAAMGLLENDEFTIEGVSPQTWRVTEILPEPVRIAQFYSSEHEHLFKDSSIFVIDSPSGSIDPFLRMIREAGAADDALVETIFESAIPLSFVADQHDCSALRIAGKIRSKGKDIPTGTGASGEKALGERVARKTKAGLVFDEMTMFNAAELGMLSLLREQFGTLYVPSIALVPLKERLEMQSMHEGEAMSLDAIDGQVYRDIRSAEEHAEGVSDLQELIRSVERQCEVVDVVFPNPDDLPDAFGHLIEIAPTVASTIELAKQKAVPILSDDANMRAWAMGLEKIEGFWLNSTLCILRNEGMIDATKHVELSARLSGRQHKHHWITGDLLCEAYDDCEAELGEAYYRQLYSELGGPTACVSSHSRIVARVCEHVLEADTGHVGLRACRDLIDQCLSDARGERLQDWIHALSTLLPDTATDLLRAYCVGHFVHLWDEG